MLELAAFHQLSEKAGFYASVMQTYWSDTEGFVVSLDDPSITPQIPSTTEELEDSIRYSIGGSYTLNPKWALRTGYAYDQTPTTDANRTLRLPDGDKNILSIGATWHSSESISWDVAYQYINSSEEPISEAPSPIRPGAIADFSTTTSANVFAVQLNYNF